MDSRYIYLIDDSSAKVLDGVVVHMGAEGPVV